MRPLRRKRANVGGGWLLPLVLTLTFAAPASAAGPGKKAQSVSYGIPRLAPGQLWVFSIPAGLEVRIGESPISGKVVGRTPVVVEAADVGPFVTVTRKEYGADLPPQGDLADFSAKTSHSAVHQEGRKETDYLRAITYEVKLPARRTVIALFQPRSLPLSKIARLYPPGSSFPFSDRDTSKLLEEKGAAAKSIPEALRLLHRGGKVSLPAGRNWLVAEVTAPGVVEVIDLASLLPPTGPVSPEHTP